MIDRAPPYSPEAEESVLSSILSGSEDTARAFEGVRQEMFHVDSYARIFQAAASLFNRNDPIGPVTIVDELRNTGNLDKVGGLDEVSRLINAWPSIHLEQAIEILDDKWVLRQLMDSCQQGVVRASEPMGQSAREILDTVESAILSISQGSSSNTGVRASDAIMDTMEAIDSYDPSMGGVTGLRTGFEDIDKMTTGLQPGQLVVIAARPSMGKTAWALNAAMNVATEEPGDGDVAVFSLEMSSEQLMERLVSAEARVSPNEWKSGKMTPEVAGRLGRAAGQIAQAGLWIDDKPAIGLMEMRAKCRRLVADRGLKMVVVDYLQLMDASGLGARSREQEVAKMSQGLKNLARELEVPVVCLSQLSRAVENRENKRPVLSDLRESGAIEQAADIVCFLYRPEYYYPDNFDLRGAAELIIAKQRNGPTGKVGLYFHRDYTRFDSVARDKHA